MRRRDCLWLLLVVAMIRSPLWAQWEPYNKNHGPFEPNSWPAAVRLYPCDAAEVSGPLAGEIVAISCYRISDRPSAPRLYAGSTANHRGTWLLVKDRKGATVAGPQQVADHSPSWVEVFWADLNRDGREDFVFKQLLGGNGTIYTFACNVTFAVSRGDGYVFTATEGLWSGLPYFADLDGDGICEFIHTAFVNGNHIKGQDGRAHNYWVYNVLGIRDGQFQIDERFTPEFPKWIWYSHAPNHSPTTQITPSQQQSLWQEQPDRIFWRPKTESQQQ